MYHHFLTRRFISIKQIYKKIIHVHTIPNTILRVFLELTLEDVPLLVANNLHNLLPLSMDNFDMSRGIHGMEIIKLQMKILQEAQETSLAAHVAFVVRSHVT